VIHSIPLVTVTAYASTGPNVKKFALPDHVVVAGFDFFDDDELVITLSVTLGDPNAGAITMMSSSAFS
jgi:hypothetical protein